MKRWPYDKKFKFKATTAVHENIFTCTSYKRVLLYPNPKAWIGHKEETFCLNTSATC